MTVFTRKTTTNLVTTINLAENVGKKIYLKVYQDENPLARFLWISFAKLIESTNLSEDLLRARYLKLITFFQPSIFSQIFFCCKQVYFLFYFLSLKSWGN